MQTAQTGIDLAAIQPATRAILEQYGFDADRFAQLAARVASGDLSETGNIETRPLAPPPPSAIHRLPASDDPAFAQVQAAGMAAVARGQVAMAVLNGGMATRFDNQVKGIVEAVDGRSFLEWKLREAMRVAQAAGGTIPCVVMNSFATDAPTRAFLATLGDRTAALPEPLFFSQAVALRMHPDGTLFRDADGEPSLYGPGHGDFHDSLRASGTLAALRSRGVRYVMLSNVDNLGARIDPAVLGMHIAAGLPMTVEVAAKNPGDVGGAPVQVAGRTVVLEGFRFPPDFDQSQIPVFNCNSFVFDIDALDADYPLTWFYVTKAVRGQPVVQLERLVGELSSFIEAGYIEVPRTGPRGRFFPVKTRADLDSSRDALREMLNASLTE